jgi:hypothetical protein
MKLSLLTAGVLIMSAATVNAQSENMKTKTTLPEPGKKCVILPTKKNSERFSFSETIRDANGKLILITKNETGRDTIIPQRDMAALPPEFFYGCGIG